MEKKGIDISYHQGNIDFNKLKGNVDFVMVRTSYGNFYEDKKHKEYIKELEKYNIPYGLYHFSYAISAEESKKEAEKFIKLIKNYNPSYPVVIDIEASSRTDDLRNETLVDITKVFCEKVEKAGYYVMIYANLDYLNNKLNDSSLEKYDKWLAQWSSKPTYNKPFGMWQYSSKGKMPGISGNVDLNISYKDYPNIIKNNSNEGVQKPDNEYLSYVVKKGDTLSGIASKFNTTYKVLSDYNSIKDPNKIYVNQIIKIPNINESQLPNKYVVKKGDTLVKIANKYKKNWKDIYMKNKKTIGDNPNRIKPGQILYF